MKSKELRDDCGPVFLSKYPEEGDVLGWLEVYKQSDPFGIFAGHWASDAEALIISLQKEVDELKARAALSKVPENLDEIAVEVAKEMTLPAKHVTFAGSLGFAFDSDELGELARRLLERLK